MLLVEGGPKAKVRPECQGSQRRPLNEQREVRWLLRKLRCKYIEPPGESALTFADGGGGEEEKREMWDDHKYKNSKKVFGSHKNHRTILNNNKDNHYWLLLGTPLY